MGTLYMVQDNIQWVVNSVATLYKKYNIIIALNDLKPLDDIEGNSTDVLRSRAHENDQPRKENTFDIVVFFSHKYNEGISGQAFKDSTCETDSVMSINQMSTKMKYEYFDVITLAHEIGHSLGLPHTSEGCSCAPHHCIMDTKIKTNDVRWSVCSSMHLNHLPYKRKRCLSNFPKVSQSLCGNYVVDEGEDCDCGLAQNCNNPCCNPLTCKLKQNKTCGSGVCCDLATCQIMSSSSICRRKQNECDIAEYCDGRSNTCPPDKSILLGTPCSYGVRRRFDLQGLCYKGQCIRRRQQCVRLFNRMAKSGKRGDFIFFNTRGDMCGNCGYQNTMKTCLRGDELCGKLVCQTSSIVSSLPTKACCIKDTCTMQGNIPMTYVQDGTRCGYKSMCVDNKCRDINTLRNDSLHGD